MKSTFKDYSNDDGTLTIRGIGTNNPVFHALDAPFDDYCAQFNEFKCRVLSVQYFTPNRRLDLSKITHPGIVWRALLHLHDCTHVVLPDNARDAFKNLVVLEVNGIAKTFFSFASLPALKVLDVTYDAKACDWQQHAGIIDLTVHGFKEHDLSQLVQMKSLKRLSIVGGNIKSLAGIENLPSLETICLYKTLQLLCLDELLNSKSVKNIKCEAYRKVRDWRFLTANKNIEFLSFDEADSLDFIAQLPALKFIYCKKVGDKDQSPVKAHASIQAFQVNKVLPIPFYTQLVNFEQIISAPLNFESSQLNSTDVIDDQPSVAIEPNGFENWSDAGSVLIANVKDQRRRNPIFSANGSGFNEHAALIDENNCRFVKIMYPAANIDLSLIRRPENIVQLHVEGKGVPFKVPPALYDGFTHLIDLTAIDSAAESFLHIKRFNALKKLTISYGKQSNWLEHAGIIDLHVRGLKTKDLRCFAKMHALKRLRIDSATIESLAGLELLPELESLLINDVKKLSSFEALFQSSSLRHLSIDSKITDWRFLADLKNLETLRLYRADSIQFIEHLPALQCVACDKLTSKDRSPISNHPRIQWREAADARSRQECGNNLPNPLWNSQLAEVAELLGVDLGGFSLPL